MLPAGTRLVPWRADPQARVAAHGEHDRPERGAEERLALAEGGVGEPRRDAQRVGVPVPAAAHQVVVDLGDPRVGRLLGEQERHVPLHDLHATVDVAQALLPPQVTHRGDQVHVGVRVVDGDRDRQRLVVVPAVDHDRPRAGDAGADHHVLPGEVTAHEVHRRLVGHRVLGDVVPGAEGDLVAALRGQLGDDPLGAAGPVADQHHVLGQVQRDHSSRATPAGRTAGRRPVG